MPHKNILDYDIFSKLPNEIYYKILANIEATDLLAITLASKRIYQILKNDDYVWHLMCKNQYPKKRILEVKENMISDIATKKELKDIERKRNEKRNSTTNVRKREEKKEDGFTYGFEGDSSNEYNEEYCNGEEFSEGEEIEEQEEKEKEYCDEQNEMNSQKNIITWKDLYKYLSNPIVYMAKEREICWLDCSEAPFNRHHWSTVIYPESECGKVVCLNYVWLFKNYQDQEGNEKEERKEERKEESEKLISVKAELSSPNLFKEISLKNDWVEHQLYHQIVIPEIRNNNDGKNYWYNVECKISNNDRYQKRGLWIDYVKLRHRKKQ
ncbi:4196_t:CDS:2 [Diversispora eburnea]|uniref:4196_t:CDS:1 n=1 Tax=Diversispora eburnea TaxID=1213867 RepID=A0A9N9A1U5_9GLOM|nr:4196_t:CDS:2 [Diversispora eburnea]